MLQVERNSSRSQACTWTCCRMMPAVVDMLTACLLLPHRTLRGMNMTGELPAEWSVLTGLKTL